MHTELRSVYRKSGENFTYGGADIRVLAPNGDPATTSMSKSASRRNDESLVLRVAYGNTSALLEADAEKLTERFITTENPEADVLKVAHHGSASSTNYNLLAAVHPRFAVISVGARNVYHHPRHEVLGRLQQAKVITFRTDEDGATSFFLDGRTVTSELAGVAQAFTYESVSPSTSGASSAAASNSASSATSSAGVRR
jgi:competence protein ComEC